MSTISSISSYSQALLAQQSQQRIDPDHDGDNHNGFSSQAFKSRFEAAAKTAGADPTKVDSIFSQVQKAIQDASQNSNGTDSRSAIRQAIESVLNSNGIDPAKFHDALQASNNGKARRGRHHHGANGQSNAQTLDAVQQAQTNVATTIANLASGTTIDTAA